MCKVAVIGSATCTDQILLALAAQVGRALAHSGCVVLTGACGGIPQAAEDAAMKVGGTTLGISPSINNSAHRLLGLPDRRGKPTVWTGKGLKGRNVIMMEDYVDSAVVINGGLGTLNECLIFLDTGGTLYAFTNTGGAASILLDTVCMLQPSQKEQIIAL